MRKRLFALLILISTLLTGCTILNEPTEEEQVIEIEALENIDISLYEKWLEKPGDYTIYVQNDESPFSNNAHERFQNLSIDQCNDFYDNDIFIVEYNDKYYHYRDAIELGIFTLDESISYDIAWECKMLEFRQMKGANCELYEISNDIGSLEEPNPIAKLGDYNIYRTGFTCMMVVGNIIVDGYYFGYFSVGCDDDLDNIGYYAEFDGVNYGLQDLVDDEILTVKEIYEMHLCILYGCDDE